MKVLTWLLAASVLAPAVLASPGKPPCSKTTKPAKTTTKPVSKPTKIPTPVLVNGDFEKSDTSFAPWVEVEGPWGLTVTKVGAHNGNSLLVTAPQFANQVAGFSISQTLTSSSIVAGVEYTLTGWAYTDTAHDATHGCTSLHLGCNGAGKSVAQIQGAAADVGKWKQLKTTCTWTAAQIAKGPTVLLQGTSCSVGHYLFDDIAIVHA